MAAEVALQSITVPAPAPRRAEIKIEEPEAEEAYVDKYEHGGKKKPEKPKKEIYRVQSAIEKSLHHQFDLREAIIYDAILNRPQY